MPTALITGCDRGLGLALARAYAVAGWRVLATTRDAVPDAGEMGCGGDLSVHRLDVTRPDDFKALRAELGSTPIDLLLSNAALGIRATGANPHPGEIDYEVWQRMLMVNVLGPVRLVETFLENVAASEQRKIVFISSRMGSIGFNRTGRGYAYRSSKAALNAAARSLSVDLLPRGIAVLILHPGNAKTYPPHGTLEVAESVEGIREVIEYSSIEDTGTFLAWNGTVVPW